MIGLASTDEETRRKRVIHEGWKKSATFDFELFTLKAFINCNKHTFIYNMNIFQKFLLTYTISV
jgi:hypothetical protein